MTDSKTTFPVHFFDEMSGKELIFQNLNHSYKIKFHDRIGENFMYWVVIISGEPQYVFPGDCSYL